MRLTLLENIFFVGYANSLVYRDGSVTISAMEDNIISSLGEIPAGLLERL